MPGSPAATTTVVKTFPSFLEMFEDFLLERVDVGRQRSSSTSSNWLDYNHFGKTLHQQVYKVLRKGFEAGLSQQQVSNVFANQEALHAANVSPHTDIDTFSGAHSGKIKIDFYDDCQDIPDPSTLDFMQNNLMLLDDCFI